MSKGITGEKSYALCIDSAVQGKKEKKILTYYSASNARRRMVSEICNLRSQYGTAAQVTQSQDYASVTVKTTKRNSKKRTSDNNRWVDTYEYEVVVIDNANKALRS